MNVIVAFLVLDTRNRRLKWASISLAVICQYNISRYRRGAEICGVDFDEANADPKRRANEKEQDIIAFWASQKVRNP